MHKPHTGGVFGRLCALVLISVPVGVCFGQFRAHGRAMHHEAGLPSHPNILLILIDDVGVDLLGAYGDGPWRACTPNMDALAAHGMLFRNAWANPLCSPTRAQILTGRHGFRTGIGAIVWSTGEQLGLQEHTRLLPKALVGYDNSAVGKWHLADPDQGPRHPNRLGFHYYAGNLFNLNVDDNYFHWIKDTNGVEAPIEKYATTDTADDAIKRAGEMSEPWFLYVPFQAPHKPIHNPPPQLCRHDDVCSRHFCESPREGTPYLVRAMLEALDSEIGRMLDEILRESPNTIVILLGDNGTDGDASVAPYTRDHAKATLYQGGVQVPLIISGPGVVVGESDALVESTDLYSTVTELAGIDETTEDSVSMVPYLDGSATESIREYVYAERFLPNFDPNVEDFAPTLFVRAARNARYKLIRDTRDGVTHDELYDLIADPFETVDVYPPVTQEEMVNYNALVDYIAQLGVD